MTTGKKRRITVEAHPTHDPNAVYDLMDTLNLPDFHVTQSDIRVIFAPASGSRSRTRSFNISYPNWCALRHDDRDAVVRQMLADSGIEPMKLEVFRQAGWLKPSKLAETVECQGCEERCVKIPLAQLRQRQMTRAQIGRWVSCAPCLKCRPEQDKTGAGSRWAIFKARSGSAYWN